MTILWLLIFGKFFINGNIKIKEKHNMAANTFSSTVTAKLHAVEKELAKVEKEGVALTEEVIAEIEAKFKAVKTKFTSVKKVGK